MRASFTAPGLSEGDAQKVADRLQQRLTSLIDLHLTLKHIHWNVVGPTFIGVHEMLDPQTEVVRGFSDDIAERIATLGVEPNGLPGHISESRSWSDYSLGRDTVARHLGALDEVYTGVVRDHREAMDEIEPIDPVSHDMLIEQTGQLELFQWFVRAHLENAAGEVPSTRVEGEEASAAAAAD